MVDHLAMGRKKTALAHGTENGHLFGSKRFEEQPQSVHYTSLDDPRYREYNGQIIAFLQEVTQGKIPIEEGQLRERQFRVEEKLEEYLCSFELEIFTGKELLAKEWTVDPKSEMILRTQDSTVAKTKGKLQGVKETDPTFYTRNKMYYCLLGLWTSIAAENLLFDSVMRRTGKFIPFKTVGEGIQQDTTKPLLSALFLVGKAYLTIAGKTYPLCEYLTWTHQDGKTDPVETLRRASVVVISQDQFVVNDTQKVIATLFAQSLRFPLPKENLKQFQKLTGAIRYLFAHSMPFFRGSAAVGESQEMVIYKVREILCSHNPEKSGDLEALTAPLLSRFLKAYLSTLLMQPQ